jgi:hypothetical protein
MPAINTNFLLIYCYSNICGDVKGYVIFFSIFIFLSIIDRLCVISCSKDKFKSKELSLKSGSYSFNSIGKRKYNTSKGSGAGDSKNKSSTSSRKTLSSPESRPYADLYVGRGIPKNEPIWVKDNGKERSPFGAS